MVRLPKLGVQRARQEKERGRQVSVSVMVISICVCLSFAVVALIPFVEASPEGWSEDIKLSDNPDSDREHSLAVTNDNVHVVWAARLAGGYDQIVYRDSTDAGFSWNYEQQLTSGDYWHRSPDIGVNGSNIHVVWHDNDALYQEIKYRNSTDGGIGWGDIQMISEDDNNISLGAKIAVNGSNLHVIWNDQRYGAGQQEVFYRRSVDGGITWDNGLGDTTSDRRLTFDLSDASGLDIDINGENIHVLFGDNREGNFNVYYIRSTENGATWDDGLGNVNEERRLTSNATDHKSMAIAVDGSNIHIIWTDEVWPGPDYYIYYRKSTDNGASWGPVQKIVSSNTSWATDIEAQDSSVHVTFHDWRSGNNEVYYVNSTDNGNTWNSEIRLTEEDGNTSGGPKIEAVGTTKHIIWGDIRDGNYEIYYKRSPDFVSIPEFSSIVIPIAFTILTYIVVVKNTIKRRKKNE